MRDIKYLTPGEILETYPELEEKFNWTASEIGNFLKCKLLTGYYDRTKRVAMINCNSLKNLIEFVNSSIENQKINF